MPLPSYIYSGAVYSSPSVGTTTFNLTTSGGLAIGFLDPSHIRVYTTTDGGASLVERFRPAQWDFNTARTQVTLVVPTVANEAVVIRRITPITGPLVDVPDGITLPAQRLRDLNLYNLYVTQEQYEANAAALTTAQEANTQVAIAINSIASQLAYTRYANRAAVPINPGSAIAGEILDSTNMQTFAPLAGVPSGFVGSASLIVRIRYNTGLATWQWIDYRAADADARYLLKTQLVDSVGSSSTVDPPTAKAVKTAFDKGATAQTAVDALAATVAILQTANASQYTVVADVASIPTGTNGLRIEITNSTNIQSFSPLTGRPSGFIGSALLSVRLFYSTLGSTWQWIDYKPVDPDGRYGAIGTLAATQATANTASANAIAALNSVGRNRLINGAMAVDQRNDGASQSLSPGVKYTVDRWFVNASGGTVTGQRVAGASANQYRYRNTGAAGVSGIDFCQRIEAVNSADLAGQTVTISVDLANSLLSSVTWRLQYANAVDNFSGVTTVASGSWTVSSTVGRYTAQVSVPAGATTGLQLTFSVAAQTSGTWTIGNAQLEPGSAATQFERRSIGYETAACQRYYYQPNSTYFYQQYASSGSQNIAAPFFFPVTMRAAPTLSGTSGWGNGINAVAGTTNLFTHGLYANLSSVSAGIFQGTFFLASVSAEL